MSGVLAQSDTPDLLSSGAGGLVELLALVLVVVTWAALGAAVWSTRPRTPPVGPDTTELGPESPAVVNLLTHDWRVTAEAVPATLLDLAARRHLDIEQVAGEHLIVRVTTQGEPPQDLTSYERHVLRHLQSLAVDGVVPAAALTTGPDQVSDSWWRTFRRAVVGDAQGAGLSRRRWPASTIGVLTVGAALPGLLLFVTGRLSDGASLVAILTLAACVGAVGVVLALGRSDAQRETAAGLRVASHWLGLRTPLEESSLIGEHSPAAVVIYERRLAYAAALGVAPRAVAQLPLGAEDPKVAWSSVGGRWRRVRVGYPRFVLGWGTNPLLATGVAVLAAVAGVVVLRGVLGLGWAEPDEATPGGLVTAARVVVVLGAVVAVGLVAGAVATLVRSVPDLWQVDEVQGRVLRRRSRKVVKLNPWRRKEKYRRYLAVDDGTRQEVRAWSVSVEQYGRASRGADVRVEVTPHLGHVRSLQTVQRMPAPE